MARFPEITVPRIYDELSGTRVLTMEFDQGDQDLARPTTLREAGLRHRRPGRRVHPGGHQAGPDRRLLPRRPAPRQPHGGPRDKRLVFLDLGLVGQLSSTQRVDLLGLIYAVKEVDIQAIADGFIALGTPDASSTSAVPDRHRPARPPVPDLRRRDVRWRRPLGLHGGGVQQRPAPRQQPHAGDQGDDPGRGDGHALSPTVDLGLRRDDGGAGRPARVARAGPGGQAAPSARPSGSSKELARRAPSLEVAALKWLDLFNKGKIVVEVDTSQLTRCRRQASAASAGRRRVGLIVVGS